MGYYISYWSIKMDEIVGKKFNKLTVIKNFGYKKVGKWGRHKIECQCDCGNIIITDKYKVESGHTKSCSCLKHNRPLKDSNLVGQKFTRLTVVSLAIEHKRIGKEQKRKKTWICKCECGKQTSVTELSLISGNTKSCGCLGGDQRRAVRFNDITGKRFGRWKVIQFVKREKSHTFWECVCDCGNMRIVRGCNLVTGISKSCGCLFLEKATKHGLCKNCGAYVKYLRRDPVKKIQNQVSNSIRSIIRKRHGVKCGKTFDHLPYTPQQLKEHLESLWEPWMNWDNYGGRMNDKRTTWHIDHIIPHSSFNYTSLEDEQFKKCWILSNLKPMEKIANVKKGNK